MHHTAATKVVEADHARDPEGVMIHPWNKSLTDPAGFVRVWNSGTPQFDNSKLNGLVNQLPFREMFHTHVHEKPVNRDSKRGNFQTCFGLASGQSTEMRTEANVRRNYGVAMPSVRAGTMENIGVMVLLTKICRVVGVSWEDTDDPFIVKYVECLKSIIHKDNKLGLVTWHAVPLPDGRVEPHVDKHNPDPPMSEVVIVGTTIRDSDGR